jgi:hypothetical protein
MLKILEGYQITHYGKFNANRSLLGNSERNPFSPPV